MQLAISGLCKWRNLSGMLWPEGTKSFPGGTPEEDSQDIAAAKESEADSDLKTTDGYVIDDSGRMNNFAVEPEMYVEK